MGRNVNKTKPNLQATYFLQINVFCDIVTCMDNNFRQFLIFKEEVTLPKYC